MSVLAIQLLWQQKADLLSNASFYCKNPQQTQHPKIISVYGVKKFESGPLLPILKTELRKKFFGEISVTHWVEKSFSEYDHDNQCGIPHPESLGP